MTGWWDTVDIGKGGDVTIITAYHWSSRTMRNQRMARWSGFMMPTGGGNAYFTGDTGYGDGQIFREMRRRPARPCMHSHRRLGTTLVYGRAAR